MHDRLESRSSCIDQLSAENLYSTVSPAASKAVNSQILSPSESSIAQQLPHQLLKVPFTSGVEKGGPTYSDISNLKVTL